jgi:hypothetical protein
MRNPASFGITLLAAFLQWFLSVMAAVQARRSQGWIRGLNTLGSVLCVLSGCAVIAVYVLQ